ncbi:phage holin family protein [Evtepia sp.]|uniref:phage holin family protein n=1 Tax=Evtepia sp. TaxID=2773933 RepID=UPI003F16EFBC
MDWNAVKNGVLAALAAMGSWIANALGGWDTAMILLVALMMADYITGVLVAAVWHRSNKSANGGLDSKAGFKGLLKKGVILLLVWIGVLLDQALGSAYVRTAVILFFVGNEGLSLLENLGLMGVPYPAFLQRMLEALKEDGDKGEKEKEEIR